MIEIRFRNNIKDKSFDLGISGSNISYGIHKQYILIIGLLLFSIIFEVRK